ncbi:MAG: nucleotidyltransferase domain-containing protein [bacterium]|nr:nucleotidyltransferase domain-containing protein [bacterium]
MSFGLPDQVLHALRQVFAEFSEVTEVRVYGSRAKGTHKQGSDIDLAFFAPAASVQLAAHLAARLDELPTPYSFDVTDYFRLTHPNLKEHIDRVGVVLYHRDSDDSSAS